MEYLLDQRLHEKTTLDIEVCATTKDRWDMIKRKFTAKSKYAKADLYQSFLDMKCPKGGNICEFLNDLSTKHHELEVISITVTDIDYRCTILHSMPAYISAYTSNTLTTLTIMSKVTGKPVDMEKLLSNISNEADCMKANQPPAHPRGKKEDHPDEALTVTSSGGNSGCGKRKCCKGACNHCSIDGHWVRECRTKKREEAATCNQGTQNQSRQSAQTSTGNSSTKPENKPVGSTNAVTADDLDSDSFWVVKEEDPHAHADCTVPSPILDDSDLDLEWDNFHTELESMEGHSDWLNSKDEEANIGGIATAVIAPVEVDTTPCVELYNSSASQHISLYKADFSSYTTLSQPCYLNAAN